MSTPNTFYLNQAIPSKVLAEVFSNITGKPPKVVDTNKVINDIIKEIKS